MTNNQIAENFALLSELMQINGADEFKAKSYASTAFAVEKLTTALSSMDIQDIYKLKGIGKSTGEKIVEQLTTGQLGILTEYIEKTPKPVIEMLEINGLGAKKINFIWKNIEIETIEDLLEACKENVLSQYKGFGEKTQNQIVQSIQFLAENKSKWLYADAEPIVIKTQEQLKTDFPDEAFFITGEYRRQLEIINQLEWVTTLCSNELKIFFQTKGFRCTLETPEKIIFIDATQHLFIFYLCTPEWLYNQLFITTGNTDFIEAWQAATNWNKADFYPSEAAIFDRQNCAFIPAFLRENAAIIPLAKEKKLPNTLNEKSIKGLIHCHSNWSDGEATIEKMALACIEKGMEYMVISDHSQSAFYANGLSVERIGKQHEEIVFLNEKLAPFKIFKSIESDILIDGSLDYPPETLDSFDLVIASIHSSLQMDETKATQRLIKTIENPYTNILGHSTGRLLLKRAGYPIDYKKVIDACVVNQVVIELNAHPKRLDIDWRWIDYILNKGGLVSINPDAHSVAGIDMLRFGVLVAQKGGLTETFNLSSYNLAAFENFVAQQRTKRN